MLRHINVINKALNQMNSHSKASFRIQFLYVTEKACKRKNIGIFLREGGGGADRTSAWRPACNLTPVASYITCHQILYIRDFPTQQATFILTILIHSIGKYLRM